MDNYEGGFIGWNSTPTTPKEAKDQEKEKTETEKRGINEVLLKTNRCVVCKETTKMQIATAIVYKKISNLGEQKEEIEIDEVKAINLIHEAFKNWSNIRIAIKLSD